MSPDRAETVPVAAEAGGGTRPPAGAAAAAATSLFYKELVAAYLDAPGRVPRDWLSDAVRARLANPDCRFVLVVGEPGAGKTGMMAALARSNPDWLRYFIRSDSTTPLSGGDAVSMLLRIGHQLAHQYPGIFDPELLEIVVSQQVERAGPGASVTGVKIEDLKVSPFYRTAIRVQQNVAGLSGGLVGVEIAQAIAEPRLLEVGTLSHLALLDPAAALARHEPDKTIVVLVDALDEVLALRGTTTVLDWLETAPEIPPNLRFVLSSRPHDRVRSLAGDRAGTVEVIEIEDNTTEVAQDVRAFAVKLFDDTGVLAARPAAERETAVTSLRRAARGNFAYLTAYARSLRAALAAGQAEALAELLSFEALPEGLHPLYTQFVRRMRRDIERLGQLDIASPRGPGDESVAAWEGVGQRILSVLAVARAPLSLEHLIALGAIRVWKREAGNVLHYFMPFLDSFGSAWQFFHPSFGEFLTSAKRSELSDIAVDGHEWHTRIVRHYQRGSAWADVDWHAMDDYGLLHIVEHLAASSEDPTAVSQLVTFGLRAAMKGRFHSDLPFHRIVQTGQARLEAAPRFETRLSEGVFLELVLSGLSSGAAQLDPAVYGLMARLARVEEALARAEVLRPGLHKYRALEAIWRCTPAELRAKLGPLDGVEHLVGAALEVSATGSYFPGLEGLDRNRCLHEAALALAPHDLDRALHLVEMILGPHADPGKERDAVLASAARAAAPEAAPALVSRMGRGRAKASAEAAEQAGAVHRGPLLALAAAHLREESPADRLHALSLLLSLPRGEDAAEGQRLESELRATLEELKTDPETSVSSSGWTVVKAAERLRDSHPELAALLLTSCEPPEVDAVSGWAALAAARAWAAWNRGEDCHRLLEKILRYERSLKWYGPAREIAQLAVVAAGIDPAWGEQLAEEAIALVEPVVGSADGIERSRLNGILAGIVDAFRDWDRARALRVARWMSGTWIHGGSWNSTDGRGSALAVIGLDAAAGGAPVFAAQLLAECLAGEEAAVSLGHPDPQLISGQLFSLKRASAADPDRSVRIANFAAYITNQMEYWSKGRGWRFLTSPAEVLRSLEFAFFPWASWARAVVAAIAPVAAQDLERAIPLAFWPIDPCETLIGLARLADVLDAAGDPRRDQALRALQGVAESLPRYAPAIDLDKLPQRNLLLYLDPSVRARFEAAVLLPTAGMALGQSLIESVDSWYIDAVWHAEMLFRDLLSGPDPAVLAEESGSQIKAVLGKISEADDLIGDLVRFAFACALAPGDAARARAEFGEIAHGSIRAMAELHCLPYGDGGAAAAESRTEQGLRILHGLGEDIRPLHRAALAAVAVQVCASTEEADRFLQWALEALEGADPLEGAHGRIALSAVAPTPRRPALLAAALELSERIGNPYLRDDALTDLLGPVVAAADPRLALRVVYRLIRAHWGTFVEALRRAMPQLVEALGPGVVELLDAAMRRAQTVLGTEAKLREPLGSLNGVAALRPQGDPLGAAAAAAQLAAPELEEPDPAYLATYLDQADLPELRCVQASRSMGADPDDEPFRRLHGRQAGLAAWMDSADQPVWRLVDIRFLFDTAAEAAAYYRERLVQNSEGAPPVPDAPLLGEDCAVFGGASSIGLGGQAISLTAYSYVFRVSRVVAKLFVTQGPEANGALTPGHLFPIAQRIVERIESAARRST